MFAGGIAGFIRRPPSGTTYTGQYCENTGNISAESGDAGGIEAINMLWGVSTNNLTRKDKTWNSVPDFFYKLIKGRK